MSARLRAGRTGAIALLAASLASAQALPPGGGDVGGRAPEDPALVRAREHFGRAQRLYDEGHLEASLTQLQRAYEARPNYRLLFNLGELSFTVHDYVGGLRYFERFLAEGGEAVERAQRAEAEHKIVTLRALVGKLDLRANVAGAAVSVDDETVGTTPLAAPLLLSAGRHRVSLAREGYQPLSATVTVFGGETSGADLRLAPVVVAPAAPNLALKYAPPQPPSPFTTLSWVGVGSAGALALGAGAFALAAVGSSNRLDSVTYTGSTPSAEYREQASRLDRERAFAVGLGVASAATLGATLFFTFTREPSGGRGQGPAVGASIALGPRGVAISGRFLTPGRERPTSTSGLTRQPDGTFGPHAMSAAGEAERRVHGDGRALGKYWTIAELGRGGMADVYLAVARGPSGFNKLAVLKVLRASPAYDPESLTMFLDEARLSARLNHPNVVQTNEVGQASGRHFIAMEYLDGQSLAHIVRAARENQGFGLAMHLRVLCDVLAGLHYAHELADFDGTPLGVVHRDVSPHNVFVTRDGQVKLLDFGIAKAQTAQLATATGVLKGKITYMAPEQACGEHTDRRADLFAVGVMLWEATAHRRLWDEAEGNVLTRLVNGAIPSLREAAPQAPDDLVRVIERALDPDPERRHATAAEMRADLLRAVDRLGRPSEEELGEAVSRLFADERKAIRSVIDEQVRRAASADADGPLDDEVARDLAALPTTLTRAATTSSVALTVVEAPKGRSKVLLRAAAASLVAAAALSVVAFTAGEYKASRQAAPPLAQAPPSAPEADSAASAPTRPPPRPMLELRVAASPPEARLFLDGAPLETNPFVGSFAVDEREHDLRVEAPGYDDASRKVMFRADVGLVVPLEKHHTTASAGSQGHGRTPPKPSATSTNNAAPDAKLEGRRSLDWKDPWQN